MSDRYFFVTYWEFDAPLESVWTIIKDSTNWPAWWRGVLQVREIEPGNHLGVGAVSELTWKSALPYSLTFRSKVINVIPHTLLEGHAFGELEGIGKWFFESQNGRTRVRYEWDVRTTKSWMNYFSPILKPAFKWNHDVVMRWGEKGLTKLLQKTAD